ncbi:MAG: M66 family metalloprotease, partial [Candidatus Latescibacterota bacterium]|nr:M66 family metalloprotease [Candidatus Latescibacterota bacterium]
MSAPDLTWDFFPTVPGAELRLVDSLPWIPDYFVVNTVEGPRRVDSEGERLEITSDDSRWNILKHQMALRLSAANTGRGLSYTTGASGDSSPYSFGTSLALGWVMNDDGSYSDIDNAGLAAGWTGWTGLWAGECDNGFIHELGHSFTLLHFTEGTALWWGIATEYPYDGRHVGWHPAGFDTLRRQFRTWYRVDSSGPVYDGAYMYGKNDPMNGDEAANAQTCFPQYIPYQAQKIQDWAEDTTTITSVDGVPGLYAWNEDINGYFEQPTDPANQTPIAIDVPTVTLIGTMGNVDEANQTYPPIYTISGNVFDLPDPMDPSLSDVFNGAQYLVEISYADETSEQALIA